MSIVRLSSCLLVLSLLVLSPVAYAGPFSVQVPELQPPGDEKAAAKEILALMVSDDLKLSTINLRRGTALSSYSSGSPATILVLEGQGAIHVNDEPVEVKKGSVVLLKAEEIFDVVPAEGTDMQLLVHFLLAAAEPDDAQGNQGRGGPGKDNKSH